MKFTRRTYRKAYERLVEEYRSKLLATSNATLGHYLALHDQAHKAQHTAERIRQRAARKGIRL